MVIGISPRPSQRIDIGDSRSAIRTPARSVADRRRAVLASTMEVQTFNTTRIVCLLIHEGLCTLRYGVLHCARMLPTRGFGTTRLRRPGRLAPFNLSI